MRRGPIVIREGQDALLENVAHGAGEGEADARGGASRTASAASGSARGDPSGVTTTVARVESTCSGFQSTGPSAQATNTTQIAVALAARATRATTRDEPRCVGPRWHIGGG